MAPTFQRVRLRASSALFEYKGLDIDDDAFLNQFRRFVDDYGGEICQILKRSARGNKLVTYLVLQDWGNSISDISSLSKLTIEGITPEVTSKPSAIDLWNHQRQPRTSQIYPVASDQAFPEWTGCDTAQISSLDWYDRVSAFLYQPPSSRQRAAQAFLNGIKKTGCLLNFQARLEPEDLCDHNQPSVSSLQECSVDNNDLPWDAMIGATLKQITTIHRYGDSYTAALAESDEEWSRFVRNYFQPDAGCTPRCAINIFLEEFEIPLVPVPIRQRQNISPEYGIVTKNAAVIAHDHYITDLHIDAGMQGSATCSPGCIKLWALYPPTERNLSLFWKEEGNEGKFEKLADQLSGGCFAVTAHKDVLHIPAGWLHVVYTVAAGLLIGSNWCAADDVEITATVLGHELETARGGAGLQDIDLKPFLAASHEAVRKKGDSVVMARKQWCMLSTIEGGRFHISVDKWRQRTDKENKKLLADVVAGLEDAGKVLCEECQVKFASHLNYAPAGAGKRKRFGS